MPARSKYNVDLKHKDKRTYEGIVFDSAGEMRMYRDFLLPMVESGEAVRVDRQVKYVLQEGFTRGTDKVQPITYVADFVVEFKGGKIMVLDFKGMPDSVAKLKRKMFWKCFPDIDFQWIVYSKIDGGYVPYETVQKNRKERAKARKNKEKE